MKDPTEFRQRFAAWKNGEKVYKDGLPAYGGGKGNIDFHDDVTKHIIRKEGVLATPKDIGDGKITIGSGLTQQKYIDQYRRNGNKWSERDNYIAVNDTVRGFENSLRGILPEYDQYPAEMRKALIDIIYNIGEGGLKNSPKFLSAMKLHNWNEAKRLMDWDNSDPLFGNGARKRNAERAALFDAGLAHWSPVGPVEQMMENKPVFVQQPVFVPLTKNNTDYSIETMTSPTIPLMLNSRNSGDSPLYGGSDYSFRLPSIKEVVEQLLFDKFFKYDNRKLSGYEDGKSEEDAFYKRMQLRQAQLNSHLRLEDHSTNAQFNDDRTFTDDTTRTFDDIIITPHGLTTKYGSYTDKNWNKYKLLESFYGRYNLLTGKLKFEPGLEIVSPEFDVISAVRGIAGMLSKRPTNNIVLSKALKSAKFSNTEQKNNVFNVFNKSTKRILQGSAKQPRYIASWDDFLTEPKFGKFFAEGGEAEVYESFNNPGYLTKVKLKIPEEGTTLEDLEYAVNRDLSMNQLPGVEPVTYKGFSTPKIIRKSLKQDTSLASDEFVPIWELKKLIPLSKVKVGAFDNTTYDDLIRQWITLNGYKEDVLSNMLKYGNITISDYIPKNFAFDSYGNLKLIDPMIQKF